MKLTDEQIEKLRASGIKLDREGRFWHEGSEVTHFGLRDALWRWLDRDPDGRYVLRIDPERFVYIEVEEAPFVVRSLRWVTGEPSGGAAIDDRAFVVLSDGTEEELDASTVRLGAGGAGFCLVKSGRMEARLAMAAWSALGDHLRDEGGVIWLDAHGGPYRLAPR